MKKVIVCALVCTLSIFGGGLLFANGHAEKKAASTQQISFTSAAPQLSYKGNITMWAQSYTPAVPGVYLAPNSPHLTGFQDAAQGFEQRYPGIHIKFVNANTFGTMQWYEAEAAAGRLPDVNYILFANSQSLPHGTFLNLNPYFAEPNPFIPGNQKWSDIMNPAALDMTQLVAGEHDEVDGDWQGFTFWYNKNLFKKAGITTLPHSWTQLVADSKQLRAAGIDPGATYSWAIYNWLSHLFSANYIGPANTKTILGVTGTQSAGLTLTGAVKAYESGILNPSTNPAVQAWWPAAKALLSVWDQATLDVPVNNTNPDVPNPLSLFAAQKVAIIYVPGTAIVGQLKNLPSSQQFPYGTFNITSLKGTSKYATNMVTFQDVGGPFAGFEYAVATPKSDSSLANQNKLKAVLTWVEYFSTPKWDQRIVNEQGNAIPIFKGAKALRVVRPMQEAIQNNPFWTVWLFDSLGPKAFPSYASLFLEYVRGDIPFATAEQRYNQLTKQTVEAYKTKHHIS